MNPEEFDKLSPMEFIKFLAGELTKDYDHYMNRLENTPSSDSSFTYLWGYTDYCEETSALVERYLRNHE